VDLTNVKSGVMSRTRGSGTRGSGTGGSGTRGSGTVGSARAEGVYERRECTSGGSVQVEEGRSSRRKVRSWT